MVRRLVQERGLNDFIGYGLDLKKKNPVPITVFKLLKKSFGILRINSSISITWCTLGIFFNYKITD